MADTIVTIGSTSKSINDTNLTGKGAGVKIKSDKPVENSVLDTASPSAKQQKSYSPGGSNPMTKIRDTMTSYGFDNSQIGYNDKSGAVTYSGTPVIIPSNVEDGTSYAPSNVINSATSEYLSKNGYSPVRSTLNSRGIDDSRIGYNSDTGYVTVDGKDAYKPQYNIDGTTYAGDTEINELTRSAYESAGEPLVAARDYVTGKGYTGLVNWDGDNVIVGGQAFKPVYVKDGTAYLKQSDLDAAINDYEQQNEIITNRDVNEQYENRYGSTVDAALDKILEREQFTYDPETDPGFNSYRDKYLREAEDAFRSVLEENNTSLYGASGAVLSEALAAKNDAVKKIADAIPELMSKAYDRYTGETQRLTSALDSARTVGNDSYSRLYQENRDTHSDLQDSLLNERNENQRWFDNDISSRDADWNDRSNALNLAQGYEEYNQLIIENTMDNAYNRGYFTADDERVLPWLKNHRNSDGSYNIDPWTAELTYNYLSSALSGAASSAGSSAASLINSQSISALKSALGANTDTSSDSVSSPDTSLTADTALTALGGILGVSVASGASVPSADMSISDILASIAR